MADFTSGKNWSDFYSGILPPASTPKPDAVNWDQFYSGILPSASSAPPVSPNLTAAEQQLLQQQLQQSQALQAGYNPNGTPKIRPAWTIPSAPFVGIPATPASWNSIDQAGYNAAKKPGTWLAQSRMNAQALMRQMAALQGGMPIAPGTPAPAAVPARDGGLAALITGKGTPRAKSSGGLAAVLAASQNPYQTPEHLQSKGYKDAYKSSSGNVSGVSQYGRFYDLDRNEWVDTTKKSKSPSGERTYAMGAS